jgi:hypothetical protein
MTVTTQVATALSAGPWTALTYQMINDWNGAAEAPASGVQLQAGSPPPSAAGTTGLNTAGLAAVTSAVSTYLAALSAAKRYQLAVGATAAQAGCPQVHITPGWVSVPCHGADIASFGATLAAVLNNTANYGGAGT